MCAFRASSAVCASSIELIKTLECAIDLLRTEYRMDTQLHSVYLVVNESFFLRPIGLYNYENISPKICNFDEISKWCFMENSKIWTTKPNTWIPFSVSLIVEVLKILNIQKPRPPLVLLVNTSPVTLRSCWIEHSLVKGSTKFAVHKYCTRSSNHSGIKTFGEHCNCKQRLWHNAVVKIFVIWKILHK